MRGLEWISSSPICWVKSITLTYAEPNRWVRQGQKLITLTSDGTSMDLLSPVEGVVMAINNDVLREPSLVTNDPYREWMDRDGEGSGLQSESEKSDPGIDGSALDAKQRVSAGSDVIGSVTSAGAGWRRPDWWSASATYTGHAAAGSERVSFDLTAPLQKGESSWPRHTQSSSISRSASDAGVASKLANKSTDFPLDTETKLSPTALTIVEDHGERFVRRMCMHCQDPACASACLVGALKKTPCWTSHL